MTRNDIKTGAYVRHFKGGIYKILCIAKDTETGKESVVYIHNDNAWIRDIDMFLPPVDKDKYPDAKQDNRFELVDTDDIPTVNNISDTDKQAISLLREYVECGTLIDRMKVCSNCGFESGHVNREYHFCPGCGYKMINYKRFIGGN